VQQVSVKAPQLLFNDVDMPIILLHTCGANNNREMPECCTNLVAAALHGSGTGATRQMLVEEVGGVLIEIPKVESPPP